MTISTGKYARFADGCAVVNAGNTDVLVTAVSKTYTSNLQQSFMPLTVDYRQKAAAAGHIPTNFLRRELGPSEHEILTSRLIDRSIRPLFPIGYNYETQIICNMLSIDGINDPDVLAINGASAALALSDIPWNGPVGAVRIGFIDNEIILNPTRRELDGSILNLIVAATKNNLVVMLEGFADNIFDQDLRKAIKIGVTKCQSIIESIDELKKKYGKKKRAFEIVSKNYDELYDSVKFLAELKLRETFIDSKHDKISRDNDVNDIRQQTLDNMKKSYENLDLTLVTEIFNKIARNIFRELIFETNKR